MTIFLWFLLGLWVGGSLGFLAFACLQVSRDGEQSADAVAIRGMDRRISPRYRPVQTDPFALDGPFGARPRRAERAKSDSIWPG